jgi:hypothetical protein
MPDTPRLQLIEAEADGFCDAETGVCAVPQAATAPPDEPEEEPAEYSVAPRGRRSAS